MRRVRRLDAMQYIRGCLLQRVCVLTPSDLSIFTKGWTSVSGNASVDSCGPASLFSSLPPRVYSCGGAGGLLGDRGDAGGGVGVKGGGGKDEVTVAAQVATALRFPSMD